MKPTTKPTTELWENTLSIVKTRLDGDAYSKWIDNRLSLIRYDKTAGVLIIGVLSDFVKAYLEDKFADIIERAASEAFGTPIKIRLLLPDELSALKNLPDSTDSEEIIFNPRHTFDNFIVGDNSRFAASAAQDVALAPGKSYSPLFIYGDSGLGKTHLMHAIGIYILKNFPELQVLYVSSENFTNDFVNAALNKMIPLFKEKYRGVDVLLIDDIQFISEKEKTVEEVFNTYEALYNSGKQMVFTSDRPPKDILGIDERLRGRLGEGLLVDIKPPSYEIKVAILKNNAALDNLQEDEGLSEVISFIAENIKSNVRDLEIAYKRVVHYARYMGKPFTKALAKEVLKDVMKMSGNEPTAKDIKKVVAAFYDISVASIDSAERTRAHSTPRQIAMYLCKDLAKMSFPKIAKAFGKDNSTVQYAYNKIRKDISTNEHMKNIIDEITTKIQTDY